MMVVMVTFGLKMNTEDARRNSSGRGLAAPPGVAVMC